MKRFSKPTAFKQMATLSLLAWTLGAAAATTCGATGVAVQVLGSGGPEMKGRASSAYLIWQQGKARVLVDAGGGSSLRFGESGALMSDLDGCCSPTFTATTVLISRCW